MTGHEYRLALDCVGMSQVGAARFFGVDASTSRRWISDKLVVPRAVSMLLAVMIRYKLTPDAVIALEDRVASLEAH